MVSTMLIYKDHVDTRDEKEDTMLTTMMTR